MMRRYRQQRHRVLQIVTKLLIPFILLFALYVQFHGDYGPGGGFQAGVIFAAAFIVHGLIFGVQRTRKVLSPTVLRNLMAVGVLLYALTGVAGCHDQSLLQFCKFQRMMSGAMYCQFEYSWSTNFQRESMPCVCEQPWSQMSVLVSVAGEGK